MEPDLAFLDEVARQLRLTVRAQANLLKVARTVADLAGSEGLRPAHLAEAAQYSERGVKSHFS